MSRHTKAIFLIGIVFLIYGWACRELPIYFFWEARLLGLMVILVGIIGYSVDRYRLRKARGKRTFWIKVLIAILSFGLLLQAYNLIDLVSSDAYKKATQYLRTNAEIRQEIGVIKSFSFMTQGAVVTSKMNGMVVGTAIFDLTIKAVNKYKDVTVRLEKKPGTDWMLVSIK